MRFQPERIIQMNECLSISLISKVDRLLPNGLHLEDRDYSGVEVRESDGTIRYFLRQIQGDNELIDVTPYVGDRNLIRVLA